MKGTEIASGAQIEMLKGPIAAGSETSIEADRPHATQDSLTRGASACHATKGAANPLKEKVGTVTQAQLREIALVKMEDLNANDVNAALVGCV